MKNVSYRVFNHKTAKAVTPNNSPFLKGNTTMKKLPEYWTRAGYLTRSGKTELKARLKAIRKELALLYSFDVDIEDIERAVDEIEREYIKERN